MVGLRGLYPGESELVSSQVRMLLIGSSGDVAWEVAVTVVAIVFLVTRYFERRFFGR
jgi:hypothetical protein